MDLGRGLKGDSLKVVTGENVKENVGHSSSIDDILMEVEGASGSNRSSEDVARVDVGNVTAKAAAVEVVGGVGESEKDREAEVVDLKEAKPEAVDLSEAESEVLDLGEAEPEPEVADLSESEPEVLDLRPELTSSESDTGGQRERQEGVKKRKTDHILNSRNARWAEHELELLMQARRRGRQGLNAVWHNF